MKKICVLTSGGDAPGMNACIRAVVRTAIYNNIEIIGFKRGYQGIIDDDYEILDSKSVAHIIQRGGTFLKTARSNEFRTFEGRKKAYNNLKKHNIDGVIAIGGNGTFTGAMIFNQEYNIPFIGIPGTIDNDLFGTDYTIGYDTALNTVIEAVDKIRDTASSHNRLFFIEVMGKDSGFIAINSAIATGSEAVLIPETELNIDKLVEKLDKGRRKSKTSGIVIVAEGNKTGNVIELSEIISEKLPYYETRFSILGHIQRGGSPSSNDRILASRLGNFALESLINGHTNNMVGLINNCLTMTSFEHAINYNQKLNKDLLKLIDILSI